MKTNEEILKFCRDHKLTEDQFFGREMIKGGLNLENLIKIPEGFCPTVGENLYLDNVVEIPEGFTPIVGINLYLNNLNKIPEGFSPTVGWSLYLNNVTKIPEGFNPTVGGNLYLNNVTEIPENFNPTVGWSLFLNNVTEIPENFNPTVGRDLHLNSLTKIPEGFNPTTGWSLFLNNVTKVPERFDPIVGGIIFLKNEIIRENKKPDPILTWQNGKYCSIDRIFAEVVSRKIKDNIEILKLKKIYSEEYFFAVVKGNLSAHGKNLKSCLLDLRFKEEERDVSSYESLTLDSELSFEDMVICYRVITGACQFGVDKFIEKNLGTPKEKYKIREVIELTGGQYGGNVFSKFFQES